MSISQAENFGNCHIGTDSFRESQIVSATFADGSVMTLNEKGEWDFDNTKSIKKIPFDWTTNPYDCNPYHNPENVGLKILKTIHLSEEAYQFDMVVVWEDLETKEVYWGHDSGCSCPSPFENVRGLSDLNRMSQTADEYYRIVGSKAFK